MSNRIVQKGFTLIEAAIAIAVVAILSGIIVPLVVKNLRDAQVSRGRNDVQVIAAAIASQMKDTGRRPRLANGPNGATGAGNSMWGSGIVGSPVPAGAGAIPVNNTFTNLFTIQPNSPIFLAGSQTLFFGVGGATAASELAYKGPYLASDVAAKVDPWGNRYLVLGYNLNGMTNNLPIYIVSGGPDGTIVAANYNGGMGPANGIWDFTTVATSNDDIVVRVN
jgi:prepilin-type N-terminal cleavage/methylation domain-containing protein